MKKDAELAQRIHEFFHPVLATTPVEFAEGSMLESTPAASPSADAGA